MSETNERLSSEKFKVPISRLVSDTLWDWTCHHIYTKYREGADYKKLKPSEKRDAFRFAKILCRGLIGNQVVDPKPEVNTYQYEFMLAANLLRIGASAKDFEEVESLYCELKPGMTEPQRYNFLMYFVALTFEGKGKPQKLSQEFFIHESLQLGLEDEPLSYTVYSLWRGLLDGFDTKLDPSQEKRLRERVSSMKGSKVDKTYERNKKLSEEGASPTS